MPGRIPWERISGDDVETIIAVYVCRENPDAIRIRPSRGDGGVDLLNKREDGSYDVYQVKKFATNLSDSQRKQILNSWERVQQYFNERHWTIQNWYLVLPLDPTPENFVWFKETIQNHSSFACHWKGLTNVEVWASAMPEVYDYYMADGKEAVNQQIKSLLSAAQQPDLRDSKVLTEKLLRYAELLSSTDPNYAYSVRIISKYDKNGLVFFNRPNLLYSASITNDEGYSVVIEAIAKYKASSEFAPLKESGTIYANTPEKEKELLDFQRYGTPFNKMPIKNVSGNLKLPLLEESKHVISSHISLLAQVDPHPLTLILVSGNKHIALKQKSHTVGYVGGEWVGEDNSHVIHVRLRTDIDSLKSTLQITVRLDSLSGCEVLPAFHAIDFLYEVSQTKMMELQTLDGETVYCKSEHLDDTVFDEEKIFPWYELLSSLKTIHDAAFVDFKCPDFASLKMTHVRRWNEIEHLLRGELVIRHWDSFKFVKNADTNVDFPAGVIVYSKLVAPIGDQSIFLGYTQLFFNANSIDLLPDDKEYVLHSSSDICDLLIEHKYEPRKPEDRDNISRVTVGPLMNLSEYQQYVLPKE
ncbi:hypothetical protein [Bifidobacterium oedipodis]|uniref:Restriction endonuclease type IV Mrr domain-containing protein n=1 Tax=Bifidobacterium oedipodis TaxID=2675322 RepID=A0A7Y0HS13_9BIFI|nr:hypothetical protein [Bifidobacterium sp. DSM 109957]NMM93496.1 hypothetical protein [Bifidobacterium sp. DSM 109957]